MFLLTEEPRPGHVGRRRKGIAPQKTAPGRKAGRRMDGEDSEQPEGFGEETCEEDGEGA